MDAREQMLTRVRAAIGRQGKPKPKAPPEPLLRFRLSSEAERLRQFRLALEALSGVVEEVRTLADARQYVDSIVAGRMAVASNHPFLAACGIPSVPGVKRAIDDPQTLRTACAEAAVGITSAYCLLAETGTVVLRACAEEPRLVSLLPPVHIAVVPRRRLLGNLDEMLSLVARPVEHSSSLVFITGPSRTGDIEGLLVRGVHGPGEVHVVITAESA